MRAIFVAGSRKQAETWARAWGFTRREWSYLNERNQAVRGLRAEEGDVVFVCGSEPIPWTLVRELEAAGFTTYVDAHDLDTFREPRSALDLLPRHPLRPT